MLHCIRRASALSVGVQASGRLGLTQQGGYGQPDGSWTPVGTALDGLSLQPLDSDVLRAAAPGSRTAENGHDLGEHRKGHTSYLTAFLPCEQQTKSPGLLLPSDSQLRDTASDSSSSVSIS